MNASHAPAARGLARPSPLTGRMRAERSRSTGTRRGVVSLAALLLVVIAWAAPHPAAAQGDSGRVPLEGPTWQLLSYRNNGQMRQVPPGIAVTASFFADFLRGEGACSSYSDATYALNKESLDISPPQVTTRGCDAEAQAIDDAFYRALDDTATQRIDGTILELRDAVREPLLRFTRASVPDDVTIAPWEVARIGAEDGSIRPVIQGTSPSVEFTRGGRLFGSTGCGWFLGSYTTNGARIDIGDLVFNPGDCTPALLDQAEDIVETLGQTTDFAVLPAGLTLEDANGTTRLALLPSITLSSDTTWVPVAFPSRPPDETVPTERLVTSSVRFGGARADGRSICRSYGAESIRSGLALSVYDFQITQTKGNCRSRPNKFDQRAGGLAPQAIEDAFREALLGAASHALRGSELELMDANGVPILRLVRQPEFVGVEWELSGLTGKLNPPAEGTRITAIFERPPLYVLQGEMTAEGQRARTYDAFYSTPGASTMSIEDIVAVPGTCTPRRSRRCRQEANYLRLLSSADSYVVLDDELQLRGTAGGKLVTYRRPQGSGQGSRAAEEG